MFKTGIIIFFGIHLVPLISKLRFYLKDNLGESLYMSLYSLVALAGLVLIILGYESSSNFLFSINANAYLYKEYLMFVSFVLLIAAGMPTYIKKITRHPMSYGMIVWASLHLLVNPDLSSVILFGSFLAYSIISVLIAELRTEETNKALNPTNTLASPKVTFDVLSIILAVFFTSLAFHFHEYFTGVNLV